jgi:hypothetical protein
MITRGEELLTYLRDRLETEKGSLGLAYVTIAGDRLTPEYPAAVISYDRTTREDHTTHYFLVQVYCDILLLHASLNESRQERTLSDLELVTRVVTSLHADRTLGGEVIHSYVQSEDAGVAESENLTIVGTRLSFVAEQREAFK